MPRYRFRDYSQRPSAGAGDYLVSFFRDSAGQRPVAVNRADNNAVVASGAQLVVPAGSRVPDVVAPDNLMDLYVRGPNLFGNVEVQPLARGQAFTDAATVGRPDNQGVTTFQQKFREGFAGTGATNPLNPDNWQTIVNGVVRDDLAAAAGMSLDRNTAGELRIIAGTTANQETILRCKKPFISPFQALFYALVSQKIVNQAIFFEMVDVTGTVVASWCIDGNDSVTATMARYEVQNGGPSRLRSGDVAVTAVTAVQAFEIEVTPQETYWYTRLADNVAGRSAPLVRNAISPDPNTPMYAQIRVVNKAVAPASSTTVTVQAVVVADYSELTAEVTSGRGGSAAGIGIPVNVASSVALSATVTTASASSGLVMGTSASAGAPGQTKVVTVAGTNPAVLRAAASRLYGYTLTNRSAVEVFVKFYNKLTAPVPGTDVPVMIVPLRSGERVAVCPDIPLAAFTTGLGWAVTAGLADTDATAVAAGDVVGSIFHL